MNFNFKGNNFEFNSIEEAVFLQNVVTSESITREQLERLLDQCAAYNTKEPERHFLYDLSQDFFVEDMSNPSNAVGTPQDQKRLKMGSQTLKKFRPHVAHWRATRGDVLLQTAENIFPKVLDCPPFFGQVCVILV